MWNQKSHINNISHGWLRNGLVRCLGESLGQATTEIAVMGIIMLVIFGALLRYGQMFNAQQEAQMYAFRKSLELANKRISKDKFGGATMVVMKEYTPVDLFSSEPQPTYASGTSTVTLEPDQMKFNPKRNDPTMGVDGPATYYQAGNDMIKNNELIEAPYMKVQIQPDKHKGAKDPLEATNVILNFGLGGGDDPYDTYQSVPFWETNQTTNGTYVSQEQKSSYYASGVKSDYSESSSKELNTDTTYEVQPVDKIMQSDDQIKQVYFVPPNMIVEQNETIEKERSYSAW